ncbi:MAG: FAD-binding oxidoreductase, partial [Burkholderiaceae bacterium]
MTEQIEDCDFLVAGAGIAGASAACALAAHGRVCVVEREPFPGYHSTGRSAAIFLETYGNATVRGMTRASRAFLEAPPPGFSDCALTSRRGALFVADRESLAALRSHQEVLAAISTTALWVEGRELAEMCPGLDLAHWVAGIFESDALDIDVHALHQGFLRRFKHQGGRLFVDTEILEGERAGGVWRVRTNRQAFRARWIVDAAGAWADAVAVRLGVRPLGLSPRRRTVVTVDAPEGAAGWPYVGDISDTFYFKPDAGKLLASP